MLTGLIVGAGVVAAALVYPFAGAYAVGATVIVAALIAWHFSLPKE